MTSAKRQSRPTMPTDWCPFCPGSGKVPDDYDVLLYPNDYPHLMAEPPDVEGSDGKLLKRAKAHGFCDVVLYSPKHDGSITDLPEEHLLKLFALWKNRTAELMEHPHIKYVHIFENKGEVIGVTIPHPHGQIYSYPFIPMKIERETVSAMKHFNQQGRCLFCDILNDELLAKKRIVMQDEHFVSFVPFYAEYPYEVHIYPRRHILWLTEMDESEASAFMASIKRLVRTYDSLFGFELPFIMTFHQAPVDGGEYRHFHFHVEFYPFHRAANKIKYNAGSEMGAWAFTNPALPEEKAAELCKVAQDLS